MLAILLALPLAALGDEVGCRFFDEVPSSTVSAGARWLERDALFRPLTAHPKESRIAAAALPSRTLGPGGSGRVMGWISAGGAWSLGGWRSGTGCDGILVGLDVGIHAQFDLSTPSRGLANADYEVALPVTWRYGRWSGRFRLHHQSSHLGDEYLLAHPEVERLNLSFEALEVLVAVDVERFRVYAGGGLILRSLPALDRGQLHWGVEYRSRPWWSAPGPDPLELRWVGGLDVELLELRAWEPAWSGKLGLEVERARLGAWRLLLVWYRGYVPFGQFLAEERIHALGVETAYHF